MFTLLMSNRWSKNLKSAHYIIVTWWMLMWLVPGESERRPACSIDQVFEVFFDTFQDYFNCSFYDSGEHHTNTPSIVVVKMNAVFQKLAGHLFKFLILVSRMSESVALRLFLDLLNYSLHDYILMNTIMQYIAFIKLTPKDYLPVSYVWVIRR